MTSTRSANEVLLEQMHAYIQAPDGTRASWPLFGGAQWFERLRRTSDHYEAYLAQEITAAYRMMRLVEALMDTGRIRNGWKNKELRARIERMPLFCSVEWAQEWADGRWGAGLSTQSGAQREAYQTRLHQGVARVFENDFWNREVFDSVMALADSNDMECLVRHSVRVLERMYDGWAKHVVWPGQRNVRLLAQRLDVSSEQAQAMEALAVVCAGFTVDSSALFHNLPLDMFCESNHSLDRVWEPLSQAFDVAPRALRALLCEPESPWIRMGLMESPWPNHVDNFIDLAVFNSTTCAPLYQNYSSIDELVGEYFQVLAPEEEQLSAADYPHLAQDLPLVLRALATQEPTRILIWGPPGTGKSSLARALIRDAGHAAIAEKGSAAVSSADRNVDRGALRMRHLRAARRMAPLMQGSPVLVIDECEAVLNGSEKKDEVNAYLDSRVTHEIWLANDLQGIHEAFLRRFDTIVHVGPMPMALREAVARRLFDDRNVALRVAQACQTPAAIRQAHRWWSLAEAPSWAIIANQLAQSQRAKQAARKDSGKVWHPDVITPTPGAPGLAQVAGYPDLKKRAQGLTQILAHPERFQAINAKVPKGLLLAGPAGVGKTHLVRALAQELSVPLVMGASSDLADEPERLGVLFAEARRLAPCLVFLDEIDAIGGNPVGPDGSVDTKKQIILNRLLVELDGFDALEGVLVLGATHRPQALDVALTRSGRFGQTLCFHAPTDTDRQAFWAHYLAQHPAESMDLPALARASGGMSPADIALAVNQAAIQTALQGDDRLTPSVVHEALDAVYWGEAAGGAAMSEQEQWRTAVHEAGHILMAWKNQRPVDRATVRPRQSFTGAVSVHRDEGWGGFASSQEVVEEVQITLGGLLAERLVFGGAHGQGVSADLRMAHSHARQRLTTWGMGNTLVQRAVFPGEDLSPDLLRRLEEEEDRWMRETTHDATCWMDKRKPLLERLARTLLERREMGHAELEAWRTTHLEPRSNVVALPPAQPRRPEVAAFPVAEAARATEARQEREE